MRSIKSIEKGLQLLEIIAHYSDGARFKEISQALTPPLSNLTLFLNSLVNAGFLLKEPVSGKYFLTDKLSEIARISDLNQYAFLKHAAKDEMHKLMEEFNENVLLAVLFGHEIRFIERLQAQRSIQVHNSSDSYYPPHVTAGGKAILAFLPPETQQQYLKDALYHRFTSRSLIDRTMLEAELKEISEKGYAINRGEFEEEIMAVAAPIISAGRVLGSIVVQFPKYRYKENTLSEFGERIRQAAENIERRLPSG